MRNSVDILNFDKSYESQDYYKNVQYKWIDFLDIYNVSRYCEEASLKSIYSRLLKNKRSKITFIGNGNYHYVTYLLIKEIKEPFTLVLFDHHTDMMEAPCDSLVTCGSWVLRALEKLQFLKKVVIIGVNKELISTRLKNQYKKVAFLTKEDIGQDINVFKYLEKRIVTESVYISIDKDVLSRNEVVTNWDQGDMALPQLLKIIQYICSNKKVCGMDICGEYYSTPCEYFNPKVISAINKNDKVNLAILKKINEFT